MFYWLDVWPKFGEELEPGLMVPPSPPRPSSPLAQINPKTFNELRFMHYTNETSTEQSIVRSYSSLNRSCNIP